MTALQTAGVLVFTTTVLFGTVQAVLQTATNRCTGISSQYPGSQHPRVG